MCETNVTMIFFEKIAHEINEEKIHMGKKESFVEKKLHANKLIM